MGACIVVVVDAAQECGGKEETEKKKEGEGTGGGRVELTAPPLTKKVRVEWALGTS